MLISVSSERTERTLSYSESELWRECCHLHCQTSWAQETSLGRALEEGIQGSAGNGLNFWVQSIQSCRVTAHSKKYLYIVALCTRAHTHTRTHLDIHRWRIMYISVSFIYRCLKPEFRRMVFTHTLYRDIWLFSTLVDFADFLKLPIRTHIMDDVITHYWVAPSILKSTALGKLKRRAEP